MVTTSVGNQRRTTFVLGVAVALAFGGGWIALTATTAATYHLAPPIVAAAPGIVAWASGGDGGVGERVTLAVLGLLIAALAWSVILASGNEPSATIVEGLPGGVWTEVVTGALVGALAGAWQAPLRLATAMSDGRRGRPGGRDRGRANGR